MSTALELPMSPEQRARYYHGQYVRYAGDALQAAWKCGEALAEVRSSLKQGDWLPWLQSAGISKSAGYRFMALFEGHKLPALGSFQSMTAALKSLPKPKPDPAAEPDAEPKLTAAEKRLVERDRLIEQAKAAEERAQQAEQERDEARQTAEHFEAEAKVAEGFQRGRDVLEERQAEIRQRNHRISELESENGELKRENHGLRRAVKELRAELDAAKQPAGADEDLPF